MKKRYSNYYVPVEYSDQICAALRSRGQECATLTEARKKAKNYGFAVRVYYGEGSSDIIAVRDFPQRWRRKK